MIGIFGCSSVVGTGVAAKESFVSILSRVWPVVNLGIEGAGPERVWQHYVNSHKRLELCYAVFCWPSLLRTYTVYGNQTINLGPWMLNQKHDYVKQYQQELLNNTVQERNWAVINRAKATVDMSSHFSINKMFTEGWLDRGSDGLHPGVKTHIVIADYVNRLLTARLGPAAAILQ
jgi:hypothetical protein